MNSGASAPTSGRADVDASRADQVSDGSCSAFKEYQPAAWVRPPASSALALP
jgi:hypothetical protein